MKFFIKAAIFWPPYELSPSFTKTLETPIRELTRGTLFADRYEIIEELGVGGMGKVYQVEDTKINEEVALKLIKSEIASDPKTIERFRNELKTARKIRHKNICGMYDLGGEKETYYITMEYVQGEELKDFMKRSKQLSIPTVISIAQQICEGLSEAHRLGVVHRDLKPSNIMIDKGGNARIMDFGIAQSIKAKGITGAGVMIGIKAFIVGNIEEGIDATRKFEQANIADAEAWYHFAENYGLLGDREGCVRTLQRAVDGGYFNYPFMLTDFYLDSVRDYPEFQRILETAKTKHEAFKKKFFPYTQ